jgi:NAD(P)-dependent dehydrogenase (short-subunit alcohol dehydrogenase family)
VAKDTSDIYQCDITSESDVDRTIAEIAEKFGRINACIHTAAAPMARKELAKLTAEDFDVEMCTSLYGAVTLARAALKHMRAGSVFIGITTSAIESDPPSTKNGAYIAAKCALRGYLRTLAQELRTEGIRVNAVAPGFMPDGLNKDLPRPVAELIAKKTDPHNAMLSGTAEAVLKLCIEPEAFPSGTSIRIPEGVVSQL